MIFGSIRASLVRLFGGRATSVPPPNSTLRPQLSKRDVKIIGPGGVEHRPGKQPPPDAEIDGWTWERWKRETQSNRIDGWSFCRFANRTGANSVGFVFGLVRGHFGLWQQPFPVCQSYEDIVPEEQILTCITHLPSGMGIGVFDKRETAAHACLIADDLHANWGDLDPDNEQTWEFTTDAMQSAWAFNGIVPNESKHAHNGPGGNMLMIWERNAAALNVGKPEKLS